MTASEDDANPNILMWDLRNARAPEKTLVGHDMGVLSLSWCKKDSNLLLSCGKDNKTIMWNPQTNEVLGSLSGSGNWSFETQWSETYPEVVATASYDGKISVHSIQSAGPEQDDTGDSSTQDDNDFFNQLPAIASKNEPSFALRSPPQWRRTPAGASFGFGGKLIHVRQSSGHPAKVKIETLSNDEEFAKSAKELEQDLESTNLAEYCQKMAQQAKLPQDARLYNILQTLMHENPRSKLKEILGLDKNALLDLAQTSEPVSETETKAPVSDVAPVDTIPSEEPRNDSTENPVEGAVDKAEASPVIKAADDSDDRGEGPVEDLLSKALDGSDEPAQASTEDGKLESDPFAAEGTSAPTAIDDVFGASSGGDDFLNGITNHVDLKESETAPLLENQGQPIPVDDKQAETSSKVGLEDRTEFQLFHKGESKQDAIITRAILDGDFDIAADVCIKDNRLSDAFMFASCGTEECRQRVQKAYVQNNASAPYIRLLSSIVRRDYSDVAQHVDLENWKEMMVLLCTYASPDEFSLLSGLLGDRLRKSGSDANRENSSLCYIAGSNLEKAVSVWLQESKDSETREIKEVLENPSKDGPSPDLIHAMHLLHFIQKVNVFRIAVDYQDEELGLKSGWKLEPLYEKYMEYSQLLASQGLYDIAIRYVNLVPPAYSDATQTLRRFLQVSNSSASQRVASVRQENVPQPPVADRRQTPYAPVGVSAFSPQAPVRQSQQTSYAPQTGLYTPLQAASPPVPSGPSPSGPHSNINAPLLPPPRNMASPANNGPASQIRSLDGWNDAPISSSQVPRRTPSTAPRAITTPFPNAPRPAFQPSSAPPPPRPISQSTAPPPVSNVGNQYQSLPQGAAPGVYSPVSQPVRSPALPQTMPGPPPPRPGPTPSMPVVAPPQSPYAAPYQAPPRPVVAPSPYESSSRSPYAPTQEINRSRQNSSVSSTYLPSGPPSQPSRPPNAPSPAPPKRATTPASKYPLGDRSHIPAEHKPIYEVLSSELDRVRRAAPPTFQRQITDIDRRVNILFEHLNNSQGLSNELLQGLKSLVSGMWFEMVRHAYMIAVTSRDYATALALHLDLFTSRTEECGQWMVGVKRLIDVYHALKT